MKFLLSSEEKQVSSLLQLSRRDTPTAAAQFSEELSAYYHEMTGHDWAARCHQLGGTPSDSCKTSQLVAALRDTEISNVTLAEAYLDSVGEPGKRPAGHLAQSLIYTAGLAEKETKNPYHDRIHANSVMIYSTNAAAKEGLSLDNQVLLATIGQGHDLGHPGMRPGKKALFSEEIIALQTLGIDPEKGEVTNPKLMLLDSEAMLAHDVILSSCFHPDVSGKARRNPEADTDLGHQLSRLLVESDTAESVSKLGNNRMTAKLVEEVENSPGTDEEKSPLIHMLTDPTARLGFLQETMPRSNSLKQLGLAAEAQMVEEDIQQAPMHDYKKIDGLELNLSKLGDKSGDHYQEAASKFGLTDLNITGSDKPLEIHPNPAYAVIGEHFRKNFPHAHTHKTVEATEEPKI